MREAAERYVGSVSGKSEYIACPFHAEKTPSMRMYKNTFHCYGCGAHGDVLDFVGRVLGLSAVAAARVLDADFAIGLRIGKKPTLRQAVEVAKASVRARDRAVTESAQREANDAYFAALDEVLRLERNLKRYAPSTPDSPWHALFEEALRELDYKRFLLREADEGRCVAPWKERRLAI